MSLSLRPLGRNLSRAVRLGAMPIMAVLLSCQDANQPTELIVRRQPITITGDTHFTDWSEYPTGIQPAGFTQMWDPPAQFLIADDPDVPGNKFLQWSTNGLSRNRWGLAYDGVGTIDGQEVYTEVRTRSLGTGPNLWYMGSAAVRMTGTAENEGGYALWFVATPTSRSLALATWQNGGYMQLATSGFSWSLDVWYSVRLRAVGTLIQAKVWPRGTTEPAEWLIATNDATWPVGKPGVPHHDNGVTQWDYWSAQMIAAPPPPVLTSVSLTPDAISLTVGTTAQFAVTGQLSDGSSTTPVVNYSATGGTIAPTGVYSAGSVPGTYIVVAASDANPALADTSVVTVIPEPPITMSFPFTSEAVGVAPAGWTETAYPAGSAWTVVTDATASDGRILRNVTTSTSRHVFRANVIPDTTTIQEVLVKMRLADSDTRGPGVILRHRMNGSSESGYVAYFRPVSGRIEVNAFNNGAWSNVGDAAFPNQPGTWYWMRFRAQGSSLRVRAWADGAAEPGSWLAQFGNSALSSGSAGLYTYEANTVDYDYVSFATAGADAAGPVTGPPPPPPTLAQIVLTPATVTVDANGTAQFTATGIMSDGTSTVAAVTYNATGGTINSAGLYTAGTGAGSFAVIATSSVNPSLADTAVVTIAPPATLASISMTPASANLQSGATQQFAVTGQMSNGTLTVPSVTYTATGGTVDSTGLYTAGTTAGSFEVIATSTVNSALVDTSVVTITALPTLASISLTPASASLQTGATQQFSVSGQLSNGAATVPTVTYTATGGTINASGLFTAGGTPGTFSVIAVAVSDPAIADTSTLTITAPPPPPPPSANTLTHNFADGTLGAAPAGWTETAYPASSDWTLAADASATDGRVLRNVVTATNRHLFRLDAVPDTTSVQEVLVKMRMTANNSRGPGVVLRHRMNGNLESGYVAYFRPATDRVEINSFNNGAWAYIADAGFVNNPNVWYWLRFRTEGNALRLRVWADGAAEPAAWTREITNNTLATGSAGLYVYETNTTDYDAFTFAVAGASAPAPVIGPPPTLTQLMMTPPAVTVPAGSTQQFSVSGLMSNGSTAAATATYVATGGTITGSGLFTAGATPGSYTVIATSVDNPALADTSTVNVTVPPTLTSIEVTPADTTLTTGGSLQFLVVGRMSDGSTSSPAVTYVATGGSVNATGLYTAGTSAGAYTLIVTSTSNSAIADTATITLVTPPPPVLSSMHLTPVTVSTVSGSTVQFSVSGLMSNGTTVTPAVTYVATGGAISAGGLYTAGASPGTYTVIATSVDAPQLSDTSFVTVASAPQNGVNQWYTDFSSGTVGQPMPDLRKVRSGMSWAFNAIVRDDATAPGRKILKLEGPNGSANGSSRPHEWLLVPVANEQEVVVKLRTTNTVDASGGAYVSGSVTATGAVSEYGARLRNGQLQLWNYRDNNFNLIAVNQPAWVPNQWMWVRLRMTPTQVMARSWVDGAAEPATWGLTAARNFGSNGGSTTIPLGVAGVYMNTVGSGVEFGALGAAVNGATAPTSGAISMGALPAVDVANSIYSSNFSSETIGQVPAGWNPTSVTSNVSWNVFDLGGTRVLRTIGTSVNGLRVLDYGPMADVADQEVLIRARPGNTVSSHTFGAALRVNGASGNTFYGVAFGGQTIDLARWVNGGRTWIGSGVPYILENGAEYWLRARVQGNVLMAKAWRVDEPEPGSWMRISTDATIAAGSSGILHWQADTVDVAQVVIRP